MKSNNIFFYSVDFLLLILVFNSIATLLNVKFGKDFSKVLNNTYKRIIFISMLKNIKQIGIKLFSAILKIIKKISRVKYVDKQSNIFKTFKHK